SMHGIGGVVMTGETRRGSAPALPSRMSADEVTASFGKDSALTEIVGKGSAEIEQTAQNGAQQSTRGDRLTTQFAGAKSSASQGGRGGSAQLASATVEGNVVLVQQPAARAGEKPGSPMRATAQRAVYDEAGQWLRLYGSPRVEDDAMQLAAERIEVSELSGEARAEGNVKATWKNAPAGGQGSAAQGFDLGGDGPAHAVANEAEWNQKADEATFRGGARMWQDANSIAAPVIVLNRKTQMLRANGTGAKEPVRVVLVNATPPAGQMKGPVKGSAAPQVIEIHGGELVYSGQKRRVVMTGGTAGNVVADSAGGTTTAAQVELDLLPPGKRGVANGEVSQVERMKATGHVTITVQGREGTGEELVYTGSTGEYVLTGTAARQPQLTDAAHGTVTGAALIFNSRDDSVRIEGDGRRTTTETTAPRRAVKHG
ncbi:MAG TPA: hypothetical protein VFU68_02255, partial [Terracidiphilus sp.]|nr:hypothetical protein [Terracidiphilus sp.]